MAAFLLVFSLMIVFLVLQDDEFEHVKTMVACQDAGQPIISPNRVAATLNEKAG